MTINQKHGKSYVFDSGTISSRLEAAVTHVLSFERLHDAKSIDLRRLALCVVFEDVAIAHKDEFPYLFEPSGNLSLREYDVTMGEPAKTVAELLWQIETVAINSNDPNNMKEVALALTRIRLYFSTDTDQTVRQIDRAEAEHRAALELASTRPRGQPTDDDIHEAVKKVQHLMRGKSSWAIIYEVLVRKFDEKRGLKKFERDMTAISSDLNYDCPQNTISTKLGNSPWLRDPIEKWEDTNAKSLADAFIEALQDCLKQNSFSAR